MKDRQLNLRISSDLYKSLEYLAQIKDTTISQVIREILNQSIKGGK